MILEVRTKLLELSKSADKDIKLTAIDAIGEGGYADSEFIERLLDLTRSADKDLKVAAIKALGRIHRSS